jgi:alpha-L-fucosidase
MAELSRRTVLGASAGIAGSLALERLARGQIATSLTPSLQLGPNAEPMQAGPFAPTWDSLRQYRVPEWFRDAKFGIWAHWGPQCQPEAGDWYARGMYIEGGGQYHSHLKRYGHPSKFGFKDVIREWKAEQWDPARLVSLYKRVGAKYFFAMGNHHDNLDLWDSKHQPWNSLAVGPKKDLIGGWAAAARSEGLRFGVSLHAAHAWTWYEQSQRADREGPLKGVPYDGKLTKADGAGQWWEGLDPQDLYAQAHAPSAGYEDEHHLHSQWNWGNGATTPDAAYCTKFYNRTIDLINRYEPDLVYFDDTGLPLWPVSDAGLRIAAHLYNSAIKRHGGNQDAVLFGKVLDEAQRQCLTWDIERGASNQLEPFAWQTDTCLGGWHYDRGLYERRGYKSAATVIHMLADIVSKNGNLLLNVPVRGDGSIDELEEAILEEIGEWITVNGEAIFATRPWKVFGEGPAMASSAPLSAQGFNEGKGKPFTAEDVRFTSKGDAIYAILLGTPAGEIRIRSLGKQAGLAAGTIKTVEMIGAGPVVWSQDENALTAKPPATLPTTDALVLKVTTA